MWCNQHKIQKEKTRELSEHLHRLLAQFEDFQGEHLRSSCPVSASSSPPAMCWSLYHGLIKRDIFLTARSDRHTVALSQSAVRWQMRTSAWSVEGKNRRSKEFCSFFWNLSTVTTMCMAHESNWRLQFIVTVSVRVSTRTRATLWTWSVLFFQS